MVILFNSELEGQFKSVETTTLCRGILCWSHLEAECVQAAEMFWPDGGCYSQPWKVQHGFRLNGQI